VPDNVTQIWVHCWGGGQASNGTTASGAGAGYVSGIIDVTPGLLLPTITIGAGGATASAAGGTTSVGTLLTATGGAGLAGGSGSAAGSVSNVFTAVGGSGALGGAAGGSSPGTPYGNGAAATNYTGAGLSTNSYCYLNAAVPSIHANPLMQFLNRAIVYPYGVTLNSDVANNVYPMSLIGSGLSSNTNGHMFAGGAQSAGVKAPLGGAGGAMHTGAGFCAGGNGVVILVYSE